jgi:polysaccharide biosynthesis protein PslA
MMVCLFLTRNDGLVYREWPFIWLFTSAVVLVASRTYLSRLLHTGMGSGRLARRVAVIGAGDFSREFIERLRTEPHS